MPYKSVDVELEIHGNLFDFTLEGYCTSGGSTLMGSDEPPWEEVEDIEVTWEGSDVGDLVYNYLDTHYELDEIILEGDGCDD